MAIADVIKKLSEQRTALIEKAEGIVAAAEEEGRVLTDDEQKEFDDTRTEINDLDNRIKSQEDIEKLVAKKAVPVEQPKAETPAVVKSNQDPKLFLARQAHCMHMAQGSRSDAADYAKSIGDDEMAAILAVPGKVIERAAVAVGDSATAAWAGELTTINQANQAFIDMLRAKSIVARFPGRRMDFGTDKQIKIPRQTAGVSGSWTGEGNPINVGKLAFDNITLTAKKAAVIVPATNELLSHSTPTAMSLIQEDIVQGTATTIDTTFIGTAAATATAPAGILNGGGTSASAGATLANVTADIKTCVKTLLAANIPMMTPVWMMHPNHVAGLGFLRDGNGNFAFPSVQEGTLHGYPIIESTTVPSGTIALIDASQVIIASDWAPTVDVSEDATLHLSDAATDLHTVAQDAVGPDNVMQSMFQHDSVAIRLRMSLDFAKRHNAAAYYITGATI